MYVLGKYYHILSNTINKNHKISKLKQTEIKKSKQVKRNKSNGKKNDKHRDLESINQKKKSKK